MPIPLGVLAVAGAGGAAAQPAYELISTQQPTSGASITFSNLNTVAAGYKHLQLRTSIKTSDASQFGNAFLRFNSDTGSNYARHYLYADGSPITSGNGQISQTSIAMLYGAAGNSNENSSMAAIITMPEFQSASRNKTLYYMSGGQIPNGLYVTALMSGLWLNTNAITSITIGLNSGSFIGPTRISLYGLKG